MFFDCNCLIGRWPFRPRALGNATELEAHLSEESVAGALVSDVESLFVLDTEESNRRLLEDCSRVEMFYAAPILNLRMRNWPILFEELAKDPRTKAIRVHPNYHFYDLDHPAVAELVTALGERGLPLVTGPRVYDERLHNPRMKVSSTPTREIVALARRSPDLRVICVNAYLGEVRAATQSEGVPSNICFDLAFAEYMKTLKTLLDLVPHSNLVFGSNAPIHSVRAATMKVAWAEDVAESTRRAVAAANAKRILALE